MPYKRIVSLLMALMLAAVAFTSSAAAQERKAEVLLQHAMHVEQVEGDLDRAIQLYRELVENHSAVREVAAKAQLHMGLCYEKLGLTEARQAYRGVIDDFPEQREEVAIASARLASLTEELAELRSQPTFRKIEIASKPQNGVLSPDGTKLAFVSDGGVWVVPLAGNVDSNIAGEPERIADVPDVWDLTNLSSWSGDGAWIAVNAGQESWGETAIHVLPVGGGESHIVRAPPRGQAPSSYRVGLSPDGQTISFSAVELELLQEEPERDPATAIYLAPAAGGAPERLTSPRSRMPAFSPDGKLIAYVGFRERDDWPGTPMTRRFDSDLWVIPSAGGAPTRIASVSGILRGPVWSPDGKFIAAHQHPEVNPGESDIWVFPLSTDGSGVGGGTRIALPGPSWGLLAGWTPTGELGVFVQSEHHLAVYTVPASGGRAVQVTPDGVVYYPRWSPDGERIFLRWVRPKESPPVRMAYVPAAGGDVVEIPWRDQALMSSVPGGGHNVSPDGRRIVVAASHEPYDRAEGVDVWTISLDGGRPIRLTDDATYERYPCWSPDGQWVAFTDWHATSEDEGFSAIHVVPAGGGEIRQITSEADSVGDGAIMFSPDGARIAFFAGGAIKTIPVEGGQPEVLMADVRSGRHSQLQWSPDGSKIAHNAGGKIWITPLDGRAPEELRTGLPENADLSEFGWSPDGEKIVFMASIGGELEFWLISDFLPEGR